ncbi:MAG: pyruvate formate-lyase, partial [Clostridia bacterium]|nr:pyruvate formate-lyase [Clostridia bacterium]
MLQEMLLKRDSLFNEIHTPFGEGRYLYDALRYESAVINRDLPLILKKARALAHVFQNMKKHVYDNDLIAGSVRGLFSEKPCNWNDICNELSTFGERSFHTNFDHEAPDFGKLLKKGIIGLIEEADSSLENITDPQKRDFLLGTKIVLKGFSCFISDYALAARQKGKTKIAEVCGNIALNPPKSFHEALQLVFFCFISFNIEGRYAMALGRMDTYLLPFYKSDIENKILTQDDVIELLMNTFQKIDEQRGNVVNICVGGIGTDSMLSSSTSLSGAIVDAVKSAGIPGPNLSARFNDKTPSWFFEKCFDCLKTGIGYPSFFNEDIIIEALTKNDISHEDAMEFCLVGCIETHIPGKQPPWSDGRFNVPKYLELALNDGICMLTGNRQGLQTGNADDFTSIEQIKEAFYKQCKYGADLYVDGFNKANSSLYDYNYPSFIMSACSDGCLEKGLDINNGGSKYPSVHGVACMGIGTVTDSFAAIDSAVFEEKKITMKTLCDALKANFEGYEQVRAILQSCPKYGNDIEKADRYSIWYTEIMAEIFKNHKTRDGGHFYILLAANVSNIYAGYETHATPDGRLSKAPLSDAASPTYGVDRKGMTSTLKSVSKSDYTLVCGGSVVNQKIQPSVFKNKDS